MLLVGAALAFLGALAVLRITSPLIDTIHLHTLIRIDQGIIVVIVLFIYGIVFATRKDG